MLRLYVAWRLFRLVRAAVLLGVLLALVLGFSHGQIARVERGLSSSGLSTLQRAIHRDVQHALRPAPAPRAIR